MGILTATALTAKGLSELSLATAESNERAVSLFQRAITDDRGSAAAHLGLTKAYLQRADDLRLGRSWTEAAVTAGRRAVELDPSLADAYVALARAFRLKGWLDSVLKLWQERARLDPDHPVANERILWFTGTPGESLPWLHRAVEQRPQSRWGHFFLGNAHLALGKARLAAAMYRRHSNSTQIIPRQLENGWSTVYCQL